MPMTTEQRTQIIKAVVGVFGAAPGATYLDELSAYAGNPAALIQDLTTTGAFASLYPTYLTNAEFAGKYLDALLGDTAAEADKAWAVEWMAAGLEAGQTRGQMILAAIAALDATDVADEHWGAAAQQLHNKVVVAEYYSVTQAVAETDLGALQGVINGVTNTTDVSSEDKIQDALDEVPGAASGLTLTQMADNLTGNDSDNVFTAPVTQNTTGSGQLANTFETGDVLNGGEGRNVLRADLIDTGSIGDWNNAPAISATTTNIQEVYFRQQSPQWDALVNRSTIDAEKMTGVEQWWTDNSRSGVQIEDIRSNPSTTTFGMRQTDPRVNYTAYFNSSYLEGDVSATSDMTLNIYEGPAGAPNAATQLANITVREITFTVEGQQITLDTPAIREADTWEQLETALNAALDAIPGAETITLTNRGNGQFVFSDSTGREFQVNEGEALVLSVTNNITVTNSLTVGREELVGPIETDVILDAAGNGSQGGTLNIGAMSGLKGVEVFNVEVDRESHLALMQSTNLNAPNNGTPNEFLQVVNLESIGAKGNLQIGARTAALDGRAQLSADGDVSGLVTDSPLDTQSGLYNVLEVNGSAFAGVLNVAIALDNNAIGRYLEPLTEETAPASFIYTAGAKNDIFNIADLSTAGAVSSDQDFEMLVDMGAGDDRLIINVPTARAVSVDGGEGENSIVVSQPHGTNAANTFKAFAGFQTYEVEGIINTTHDFTSMSGVKNVIIATGNITPAPGGNTQLIDLEAEQDVTVSGKNQTIGNASTWDQNFGNIRLTNDKGADRTITLENTARLANSVNGVRQDGVLTVANLTIDTAPANTAGTTHNVTIDSAGERPSVANAVAAFNGRDVQTLDFIGTQDLTFNVTQIGNQTVAANRTALDIDASELEGNLDLAVNGAMIGNKPAALTDRIVGADGDSDTLMLWGAQTNSPVTVTGFETIQFGNAAGGNMFGDLNIGSQDATGVYDAKNTAATNFVITDDIAGNTALTLNNLSSGVTVSMGDANRDGAGTVVNGQVMDDIITLNSGAVAGTPAAAITVNYLSNIAGDSGAHTLNLGTVAAGANNDTNGYQTINIDIAHAGNFTAAGNSIAADDRFLNLSLTEDSRVLDISGGADNSGFRDTLNLAGAQLVNALTKVDISDYEGDVTLVMQQGNILATAAAQTDVRFIMSEDDADITLSNMDGTLAIGTGVQHNSVFEFTGAKSRTDVSTWEIDNFVGAGQAGATMDNITRFDLSDLGITSFDQIEVDIATDAMGNALAAGVFSIRSEAQNDASVLSGTNQNTWEIQVDGLIGLIAVADITEDNFIFA